MPPLNHVLGRNLKFYVVSRSIHYDDLAAELGISIDTLKRVRSGRLKKIDPKILAGLMRVLELDANDLLLPKPGIRYPSDDT